SATAGAPSGVVMSQNMRAVGSISPRQGRIWKVVGSGWASRSDSNVRVSPSIAEPSKPSPSVKAPSTSAGASATDFRVPMTSVNQSRTNLTPRSSIVRSTKSRCLSIASLRRRPDAGLEARLVGGRVPAVLPVLRVLLRPGSGSLLDDLGRPRRLLGGVERSRAVDAERLRTMLALAGLEVVPVLVLVVRHGRPPAVCVARAWVDPS